MTGGLRLREVESAVAHCTIRGPGAYGFCRLSRLFINAVCSSGILTLFSMMRQDAAATVNPDYANAIARMKIGNVGHGRHVVIRHQFVRRQRNDIVAKVLAFKRLLGDEWARIDLARRLPFRGLDRKLLLWKGHSGAEDRLDFGDSVCRVLVRQRGPSSRRGSECARRGTDGLAANGRGLGKNGRLDLRRRAFAPRPAPRSIRADDDRALALGRRRAKRNGELKSRARSKVG
jgi:hypothetical protein